jgi:hypothetical protein
MKTDAKRIEHLFAKFFDDPDYPVSLELVKRKTIISDAIYFERSSGHRRIT